MEIQKIDLEAIKSDLTAQQYGLANKCLNWLLIRSKPDEIKDALSFLASNTFPREHARLFNLWLSFRRDTQLHEFRDFDNYAAARKEKINDALISSDGAGINSYLSFKDFYQNLENATQKVNVFKIYKEQIEALGHGQNPTLNTLEKITKAMTADRFISEISNDELLEAGNSILDAYANQDRLYVPTGYSILDAVTNGMRKGELTVIAGRPGGGKTLLGLNMVLNHFNQNRENNILFFSLEMPKSTLMQRLFMGIVNSYNANGLQMLETGLTPKDLKTSGSAKQLKAKELYARALQAHKLHLCIDDSNNGAISIEQIEMSAYRYYLKHSDRFVIMIDYYQIIRTETNHVNKLNRLTEISQRLAALAKRFNVPIVVLAQLRRQSNSDKSTVHPGLDDIADCDQLAKDASLVLNISTYNADIDGTETTYSALEVVKNRYGDVGILHIDIQGQYGLIKELENVKFFPKVYEPPKKSAGRPKKEKAEADNKNPFAVDLH